MVQTVKRLPTMPETHVQSLGQEDPLEKEMATHLQYSCLENPMDRGAWWATVHGVAKSRTQLSDLTFKITADGGCSHEIKTLAPWKKSYDQSERK